MSDGRTWPKSIQLFGPSYRSSALGPYFPCPRDDVNKRRNEENNKPKTFLRPRRFDALKTTLVGKIYFYAAIYFNGIQFVTSTKVLYRFHVL